MKSRIYKVLVAALMMSIVGIYSCADLDVENLNTPDSKRAIESPDDLEGVAGGAFRTILNASLSYSGPAMNMATMADVQTCSWGNVGMNDMSSEPRQAWNNTIPYSYAYVNRDFWQDMNSALSQVNDVMVQIEGGAVIKDAATTEMVKAWCYFIQGVAHGHIAMVMEKGFIVDETTDLETLEWKTYAEIGAAAIGYLDKAIAACNAADFILPDGWFKGSTPTSDELAELANFFAAKFMISVPRNATENAAVNWGDVKTYAQNGLSADFVINFDGYTSWVSRLMGFAHNEGWMRIDMRVINLMDQSYPSRWNANGNAPVPETATSADARLLSDFGFDGPPPHRPERGYYHFSYYGYKRYDNLMSCASQAICGDLAVYSLEENNLMEAEAEVRAGTLANAIALVNAGARVTRGGLAPLGGGASAAEVLEAIFYERTIELLAKNMGIGFCDMRRRNYLQPRTLLHYPIPGVELETLGEAYYSLGGTFGTPGIDFADSDWGWPGWDVQNPY